MPNVIVTCTFNPPSVTIQGASIRQDTIDALQRALPKQTTTSLPTQRPSEPAKFLLTSRSGTVQAGTVNRIEAGGAVADGVAEGREEFSSPNHNSTGVASGEDAEAYKSWHVDLGQHYCDQMGRTMIFLVIIEALEEEGFGLRGTHSLVVKEKDITRLIFVRS
ncbi:hypothetical protein LPMP_020430 [Leishmania panamensis]|uniref:Uncharacterized protein n=6 Tax=Viannia TaxID=37616 RepID=A4H3E5_LEIBR|nr:hypothetical protein, unknown function [Leishmania braziliensis MHOM/BR/75/M2904]XP_010698188.1 hypothetical protein LPMP_020430 [Leishmania panamensis]KAI5684822.1 hypothetical protein MNV84_00240 [Leishmania braziliensis]CCM12589.1 hypothetical protein, unknown function [Leishmania guyanensis]AIN95223.1 hypothetical protein LPMP_020430 [Leishmania panamensis]CAJ2465740.1 unnamed protein product [Leishmania braziliensis]CAJ2466330.1 unnamed protein product [Leishmania braziliensis]